MTMKVLNNFFKKKYEEYHPGKKVPEQYIDTTFDLIMKRHRKFKTLNHNLMQSSLDELNELLKIG